MIPKKKQKQYKTTSSFFQVWDSNGNSLYSSGVGDYPITSVNWCYSGSYFAVGSFNTLKLCDKTGVHSQRFLSLWNLVITLSCVHFQWSYSLEKLNSGSIYTIAWSNDGTQVALACSSGSVLIAHTIEKYGFTIRFQILLSLEILYFLKGNWNGTVTKSVW